jgi:hypothetical protein
MNEPQKDAVEVTVEEVRTKRIVVEFSDWRIDPLEVDTIEMIILLPNGRPRTIKFPVDCFIPRNY